VYQGRLKNASHEKVTIPCSTSSGIPLERESNHHFETNTEPKNESKNKDNSTAKKFD